MLETTLHPEQLADAAKRIEKKLRNAKPSKKKTFHTWEDAEQYQKQTRRYPVVQKISADTGDRKDDYFELVKSFPSLREAQNFIAGKRKYLIWYCPRVFD